MHPTKLLEELSSDDEELVSCTLDELYSDDEDSLSLETDMFMEDDEELSFFSLEELLIVEDDEDLPFGSFEELLFSDDDDSCFFSLDELCEDDDSFFLLDELPFTEEDDVLVCFTLDELSFAELEESFSLLEDSTSCSREELDSTNSGWVEELLELSSPQDTNRQTALNGINNRFNMDIRSLLQVLFVQYIHFLSFFHPASDKLIAIMQKSPVFGQGFYGCSEVY
jgi:hypothetical protein